MESFLHISGVDCKGCICIDVAEHTAHGSMCCSSSRALHTSAAQEPRQAYVVQPHQPCRPDHAQLSCSAVHALQGRHPGQAGRAIFPANHTHNIPASQHKT